MSLRQLDYFVIAAEIGTMTGAAQRLHVSQSAVSLGIAELERQLGVQLLLRCKAKGLTLTEAGRLLLPGARALLARAEKLQTGMREIGRTPAGRLPTHPPGRRVHRVHRVHRVLPGRRGALPAAGPSRYPWPGHGRG